MSVPTDLLPAGPLPPAAAAPFTEGRAGLTPEAPGLREYAGVVLLCALGDVALFDGSGGLGHLLLFVGAPLVIAWARPEPLVRSPRLVALAGMLGLVALRSVWQSSPFSFLVGLSLVFAFASVASSRGGYVPETAVAAVGSMFRAFVTVRDWLCDLAYRASRGREGVRRWVAVVVPVLVVAAFFGLFVAANPVLERWVGTAWQWTSALTFLPSPLRLLLWAACVLVAAAWLRPFVADLWPASGGGDPHTLTTTLPIGPYRTPHEDERDHTTAYSTARNALVGVNLLFLLYNALDVLHLWAGRPPDGMIHTDYAHRGALWLTISLVLCTVVLSTIFRGELNFGPRGATLRRLAWVWIGQGLWLGAGTFRRVQLYVEDSGLTPLRIIGFLGTSLVVVGLALAAVKVARRKTLLWLVRSQLDAFVVATVLFTVAPTDWIATAFNVARIREGRHEPLLHLTEQRATAETVLALEPLLSHGDLEVRRGVAAILRSQRQSLDDEQRRAQGWSQWELSRSVARTTLGRLEPTLRTMLGPALPVGPSLAQHDAWSALRDRGCRANGLRCARRHVRP